MTPNFPSCYFSARHRRPLQIRTRDQRKESLGNRLPLADWRVDKVQKVGFFVRRVQVCRLARVHDGPAAERDEPVVPAELGLFGGSAEARVRGLGAHAVVHVKRDAARAQRPENRLKGRCLGNLPHHHERASRQAAWRTLGSVMKRTFVMPRFWTSMPTSRDTPLPKRTLEPATSKA